MNEDIEREISLRYMDSNIASLRSVLQADLDPGGGYTLGEQMASQIIAAKQDLVFIRKLSTVITMKNAQTLGAPVLDDSAAVDSEWTAELKVAAEEQGIKFEGRQLTPHPLSKMIKVSKTLVRKNPKAVDFIIQRLAGIQAITEEKSFMSGTGVNQPLGIFTASNAGISTARDCSEGATQTSTTADHLINCKYLLKNQYRISPTLRWIFSREMVKKIRKLKDSEGRYLFNLGDPGKPDTILDIPFEESEYCPNTFTSGRYVGILGDFSTYWIVDCLSMDLQVLTELYSLTNQNGYILRSETDGMPVDENAWVRVTLA